MKVAIVGGGISGLSTAYYLQKLSKEKGFEIEIDLLEAGSRFGGVIQTKKEGDLLLECGPDAFISIKPAAVELSKELGIDGDLLPTREEFRQSFILKGKDLHPVPEGFYLMAPAKILPFLRSKLVSWPGKIRMALEPFMPRKNPKDESVASFVRRRLGKEALDRLAQPMLAGVYSADPEELSLRATMPKFLEWEQSYGSVIVALRREGSMAGKPKSTKGVSGPRYSLFLSYKEGVETLTKKLVEVLKPLGILKPNSKVTSLKKTGEGWSLDVSGEAKTYDAIALALPSYVAGKLLKETEADLSKELESIKYASSCTLNFVFKRSQVKHPLNAMGFVVPAMENRSLLGCSFSSSKFLHRTGGDHVVLKSFVGGAMSPEIVSLDDEALMERVLSDLREILGIEGQPVQSLLTRWEKSLPQYTVGHLDRVEKIEASLEKHPSLCLVGNSTRGVGIPDMIALGKEAAGKISKTLATNQTSAVA